MYKTHTIGHFTFQVHVHVHEYLQKVVL